MVEIELEKTYLVKELPEGIETYPHREILDIYVPKNIQHPNLRIRKKGNVYEITKKSPVDPADSSIQTEHTISLNAEEFDSLSVIKGKRVRKIRYDYPYKGFKIEIAIFKDSLKGLVLADVEFKTKEEFDLFKIPEFCLADVTHDEAFAGGMLCGKSYSDIEEKLRTYDYKKLKS